jgi:ribonuclease Z
VRLTLLGAGVPTPTPRRFGSAYLLEVAGRSILVDCGPATTYKLVRAGHRVPDVSMLLFTHHHFDHNADYPCFVLTRWDQDVEQTPLRVFGPPPTASLTHRLFAAPDGAYVCDWNARVELPASQRVFANRGGKRARTAPQVDATDIDASFVLEEGGVTVRAADTVHAQPTESVIDLARGADLLVSMCWSTQRAMEADGESRGQTGTSTAGMMASQAGVGTLVLSHIGPHLDSPGVREEGIRDVAEHFDGRVVFGEELLSLDVAAQ